MTISQERQYDVYTIENDQICALLDKAHCAILPHDDMTTETLILPESARYEDLQLRDDIARFDVYCQNGYAFRLAQIGPSIRQKFIFHSPTILAFPTKITFKQAMDLGAITIDNLIYHYPFNLQALYDMMANMPVTRREAAFALARMSIVSWIAFSFDSVEVRLRDDA